MKHLAAAILIAYSATFAGAQAQTQAAPAKVAE